jgi:hypothetical protein
LKVETSTKTLAEKNSEPRVFQTRRWWFICLQLGPHHPQQVSDVESHLSLSLSLSPCKIKKKKSKLYYLSTVFLRKFFKKYIKINFFLFK